MNTGKKLVSLVISCVFILIFNSDVFAVPAAPITHTLSQPDGTIFEAKQWGDENINGWETGDDYTIVFDENLNNWAYADNGPDGSLVSSGMIVGRDSPSSLKKKMRPKDEALSKIVFKRHSKELKGPQRVGGVQTIEGSSQIPELVVPPTGTGFVPTILINFNDRTTAYTTTNFNDLLFGTGNFSMRDYYQEISYGAFSVTAGPGGVVGWYTSLNGHDFYGYANGWVRSADLAKEAVAAADTAGFNFAPYDLDGDCYVDVANIVHQGTGYEASGSGTDIWSSRWNFVDAGIGVFITNDACPSGGNIIVNDYIIEPEILLGQIHTMGIFAHEYGHALGLPDLYDTDSSSEGIGEWSLMASGNWNFVTRQGDRPAHMDAWCKYSLGWVTPTVVLGTLTNEPIDMAATNADVYRLASGTPTTGEYFLVENRYKFGFDAGIPNPGLLIWHVDTAQATNQNECYPGGPPCPGQHYKVALVQADNQWDMERNINRGDAGDPYPGSTNNTTFNNSSSPNSNFYSGVPSNVSITNISAPGSTMTATLTFPFIDLIVQSIATNPASPAPGQNVSVTVTVQNQGTAAAGSYNIDFYKNLATPPGTFQIGDLNCSKTSLAAGASDTCIGTVSYASAGTYNMWAQVDANLTVAESNEGNNVFGPQTINVAAPSGNQSDLVISYLSLPTIGGPGANISITDTTKNRGIGSAGASATAFYLSGDCIFDGGDALLGSRAVSTLIVNASSSAITSVTIPGGTALGTYYIVASADDGNAVTELDETNNTRCSSAIRIAGPDLVISSWYVPSSAKRGTNISITDITKNRLAASSGASTTAFYLSTNTTLDGGDTLLGSRAVPALAGYTQNSGTTSVTIPAGTAPGAYYIIWNADNGAVVVEDSETNNTKYKAITITL